MRWIMYISMPQSPDLHHRSNSPAWYALRRTLPVWSFEKNLKELCEKLPAYGVDELIVKVDTEEFSHGQPPLQWVQAYQPKLFQIKEAMAELGIVFSINPWITVGHIDRGRDNRGDLPGLRTCVGHDGVECRSCACPLCDVWRANTESLWTLYAQTRPHVIWVEDDIRTFNHGPVLFGCFCSEHMKRFSQRIGQTVTRQELVAAIMQPGRPHPWRAEFLDMQAELMIQTVSFLAKTVHRTSPDTHLGLMSSGPRMHCLEGRRWKEFAAALGDGLTLYSRPPMGNYSEDSLRGFYHSQDSIKITRYSLPSGVIEQTEIESVPFTRYSKSVAATFVEMAISFAYGCRGITMNLFDHCGTPMEDEPGFGAMLGRKKPFLNRLAELAGQPGQYRGVQLLFNERDSYSKHLIPNADYESLMADGYQASNMLESHGVPTTYDQEQTAIVVGQQVRGMDDEQIRKLLGKDRGLFLDGMAAAILSQRGYSDLIGGKIEMPRHLNTFWPEVFAAEEFFNPDFGGADRSYLTATIPSLGCRPSLAPMELASGAVVVSRMVDVDANRRQVASYAFENKLGGRVFVHGYDLASAYGISFLHTFRAKQLHGVVRWLSHNHPPILVNGDGVYPLAFRKDMGQLTMLGMFNLSLDAWQGVEFTLADHRQPARIDRLGGDGNWVDATSICRITNKEGNMHVNVDYNVSYDLPLVLRIAWEK